MTPPATAEHVWLVVVSSALVASTITASVTFLVMWFAPWRQHKFWARQQGLTLFLESYRRFLALADGYEDKLLHGTASADPKFTKQLLSVTQEILTFFPRNSDAWKAFVALDNIINKAEPAYTEFVQARVEVQRKILAKMGFLF